MALALLCTFQLVKAQQVINQGVNDFIVKENLLKNDKLAIIATDSLENPLVYINGVFNFSVNGFRQELNFHDGIAICPLQIDKSTFVFVKHINENGSHSKLYFIYKSDNNLRPFAVNGYLLVAIPLLLILIGYLFRKLIGLMIFILLILFYFYYSKGLSIPTFFESAIDGIKSLF
ncbi:MAG: hypothetical protein IE931_04540 [Sphingobacteriales bacterium]|nr:hypothetical protein [Sphingobacteriales bacterium]